MADRIALLTIVASFVAAPAARAVEDDAVVFESNHQVRMTFAPHSIAISDGGLVVVGGAGKVVTWELHAKKLQQVIKLPSTVFSVAVSPDGRLIAAGTGDIHEGSSKASRDQKIYLWESATGKLIASRDVKESFVQVAFSGDGERLIAGGETLEQLDTKSLAVVKPLKGFRAPFAVDAKGEIVAGAETGERHPAHVLVAQDKGDPWDTELITGVAWLWPRMAAASRDRRLIAALDRTGIALLDADKRKKRVIDFDYPKDGAGPVNLAVSVDGGALAVFGGSDKVVVIDPAKGKIRQTFTGKYPMHIDAAISKDGHVAAIGAYYVSGDINAFLARVEIWKIDEKASK